MKPNNYNTENCESKSSNCIIWAGPAIECLGICTGSTITEVTYTAAVQLCTIMDQLNITQYDLTCLNIQNGAPKDFKAFINVLIQKVCDASGTSSSQRVSSTIDVADNTLSNVIVNLAPCFQYNDPSNGDLVITSPIADYVQRIGLSICGLLSQISNQQNVLSSLSSRVTTLENNEQVPYVLPSLFPVCIASPNTALSLNEFTQLLEQQFCTLLQSTGSANKVYVAVNSQPPNFNSARALGTGGGTMGEKAGWILDPQTLSDSVVNIWITLADARSALTNIQQNCCNTLCDGIELTFTATVDNKILKLFFAGTIPSNLQSCQPGGSIFTISDDSGNSVTNTVDIKGNMNNISGVTIDLSSSPLNFADDLNISTLFCFTDTITQSMCQNYLSTIVSNNMDCPALVLSPGITTVAFQFTHTTGILTYSVQLFDATNVMVKSQNIGASAPISISGTFSSLDSNSNYRVRIQMITANSTKTCPFTPFTTLSNPCPAANAVSAVISIT